ncbi:MAG: ABC transporter ATP-binding protein [Marmoricola sp.]
MEPSSSPPEPAILARGLTRVHRLDRRELRSVDDVCLTVARGEVVALVGPSGSGKTSLLHLLGGLDSPDSGSVSLAGTDWGTLTADARARFRRRTCGFVVQGDSLLPQATAAENVEVPLLFDGVPAAERKSRVLKALQQVGLAEEAAKLPDQLSVGQHQRVALARAMITQPAVLLADEPTGSLDSHNAEGVVELMVRAARERHMAVVLATHSPEVWARADRILHLHSGRLAVDPANEVP